MPHVYTDVDSLLTVPSTPVVGDGSCVLLVEAHTDVARPATSWRQGDVVRGNTALQRGTAIATFDDGRYLDRSYDNHAAFYDGQTSSGIWIVEQYIGLKGIDRRFLTFKGKDRSGRYINKVNNGDAYSVIQ